MGLFEIAILSVGLFCIYRFYLNESQHQLLSQFDVQADFANNALEDEWSIDGLTVDDDHLDKQFGDGPKDTQPLDMDELLKEDKEESKVTVLPPRPVSLTKNKVDRTKIVLLRESLKKAKAKQQHVPRKSLLRAPLPPDALRQKVDAANKTTIQLGDVKLPENLLKQLAS